MGAKIGTLTATIGMDTKPLQQAVEKSNQLLNSIGKTAGGAATGQAQLDKAVQSNQQSLRRSAQEIAKYSLVAGNLSGVFNAAGLNAGKMGTALKIVTAATTGLIGPIGLIATAVGALAAALISAHKAADQYRKSAKETTAALVAQLAQTGAVTDAERKLTAQHLESAKAELFVLRARQKMLETTRLELSVMEEFKLGLAALVQGNINLAKQIDIYRQKSEELRRAKTEQAYASATAEIDALEAAIKDAQTALDGGSEAIARAKAEAAALAAALEQSESRILAYASATAQAVDAVDRLAMAEADSVEEINRISEERLAKQIDALAEQYAAKVEAIGQEKLAEEQKVRELLALDEAYSAQVVAMTQEAAAERLAAIKALHDEEKRLADEAFRATKETIGGTVDAYRAALEMERGSKEERLALWEEYKNARIAQIQVEIEEMRKAGIDAGAIAAHVQNASMDLAKQQEELLSTNQRAFETFSSFLNSMNQQFESAADFLLNLINQVLPLIAKSMQDAKAAAEALSIGSNFSIPGLGGGEGSADFVGPPSSAAMPSEEFATGGIVRKRTRAIVGEAGPEAIIPLSRLSDPGFVGRLTGNGGGMGGGGVSNVFQIQTPDVGGFLRSQQQIMARASLAALQAAQRNG